MNKRKSQEVELENKRFVIDQINKARAFYFGLQANQDLPLTQAEQKRGANDSKIKEAKKQMMNFIEEYQMALSHPWYWEEYMGLGHSFEAPEGAVSKYTKQQGAKPVNKEQVLSDARQREQRIMDKLQRIVDAESISRVEDDNPIGEVSEN